jgi:hypothetical protein
VRPAVAVGLALLLALSGCSVGYGGPTAADRTPADATPTTDAVADTSTPATPDEPTPTRTPTPTSTPGPTPTPTPSSPPLNPGESSDGLFGAESAIAVRGGRIPVDATAVYDRTRRLLGTTAPRPEAVQLLNTTANTTRPPEFQRLLGLERNVSEAEAAAFVVGPRTVYLNRNVTDRPAFTEGVLAHEFTHTVQFRTGAIGRVQAATAPGPDGAFASTAVIEGAATYAQDRYWVAHIVNRSEPDEGQGGSSERQAEASEQAGPGERPSRAVAESYRASEGAARYAFAPYRFGYRYANATLSGPRALPALYRDPPRTGEQVLHPGVEEPPVPLRVELRGAQAGTWRETFAPRRGRLGEAFLRVALATELDDERATRAAAGWGNDTRIAFNDESGARGYAWVVRFDDAANASAFDEAVGTYLDRRTGDEPLADDGSGRRWSTTVDDRRVTYRLVRTDDRTAVLLLGEPGFVDAGTTTVRGENGRVVVATDGVENG